MKSKRIRGFPVINLEDGSMEGRIQDLMINPEEKNVEGFLLGEKGFLKGRQRFISFPAVHSVGSDAVTIQEGERDEQEIPENLEIFKDYGIIGKNIISNEGNYIAKILDFTFCTNTGKIKSLLLHEIRGREPIDMDVYLTIDGVLNLGKDYVIADANYTDYLTEESREQEALLEEEWSEIPGTAEEEVPGSPGEDQQAGEDPCAQENPAAGAFRPGESASEEESPANEGFERLKETWSRVEQEVTRGSKQVARESRERMNQYVRNKKANYPVWDSQGNVLVHKGQIITDDIADEAEAQGKTPQLFFAVVSEEIEESLNIIGDKISKMFR